MIKHIVMWKLEDENKFPHKIKKLWEALDTTVKVVKSIEVGQYLCL